MIRAKRLTLPRVALTILWSLSAFWAQCAKAEGLDCRKAATVVERAICADANLKSLDAELAINYDSARKLVVPDGLEKFTASQRAWVAERDLQCTIGEKDCLVKKYLERNEVLLALLARSSEENPVIDIADPAVLLGSWTIAAEEPDSANSTVLIPTAAHIPPVGARLFAKPGELCVVEPPQSKICNPFGLAVVSLSSRRKGGTGKTPANSVAAVTYFNGKADFDLILGPNRELTAVYRACYASGKDCRRVTQSWHPASPDANFKVFSIFH